MAESYFPFNSVSGDRKYKAEDFAAYFAQFLGNGVFYASSEALKLKESADMTVSLQAGGAFIAGRGYINSTALSFTLDTADGSLNRIDRLAIRCDYSTRKIYAVIHKGTYSANPVATDLQRDADAYELAIADVYVGKGVLKITQANITDQRLNTTVCGIVTGLVTQADTTDIFNEFESYLTQFKATYVTDFNQWVAEHETDWTTWSNDQKTSFSAWVDSIKNILDDAAAGKLELEIEALQTRATNLESSKAEQVLKDVNDTTKGYSLFIQSGTLWVKRVS